MSPPYDVAIVGFGPTGAVLANLLGRAGRRVVVLEREGGVLQQPRAAHFDGEVMRVFQNAGVEREVMAIARPGTKGMHFVNARGDVLMIRAGSDKPGPHGYTNSWYFHQPDLEQVLRDGVARLPGVQVELRREVVGVAQSGDGVTLDTVGLDGTRARIRAHFTIGCDGARSTMRKAIGSAREDLGLHQPWLCVDVLMDRDVGLPEHSVQLCDPARPMTLVNMSGRRRRWEIMLMPGDDPSTLASAAGAWPLLAPWITPADATLERAAIYTFHSVIARGWRDRRVLIAGDAAHQTPPFLGQGMCAGIRDAANLAWKLDEVCTGGAPEAVLDSYETERSPHVRAFIDLAVRLGAVIQTTDPAVAVERDRRLREVGTEVFAFPSPALGPGWLADAPAPVGTVFPQLNLPDGRLDDVAGTRWTLLAAPSLLEPALATLARRGLAERVVVPLPGDESNRWLAQHGAGAVLLRPDRYVYGLARGAPEIDPLVARSRRAPIASGIV